ncbi:MAG: YicC family protein [Gemmatimonadota bacterium]|jgi:uncharacterized protein (TIGR00255 family)|nr:YicC family protein [Gemmatimonadota bacterium]
MIRSMTGFGEATGPTSAGPLRVELRTVNHRYLNVNTRLPASLARWENEIREWLRGSFERGHVNCTIRWDQEGGSAPVSYRIDTQKVEAYLGLFRDLQDRFGVPGTPDLALLTRYNDIIVRVDEMEIVEEVQEAELKAIVREAAVRVVRMREDEGARLDQDLRGRIAAMERALAEIQQRAPERLVSERKRLTDAVAEIAGDVRLDANRLAQEIALLAERWDVNEELVRFRSHNELFTELLNSPADEPVGKRLSFLVQEMHREANTIGSKANDAGIAHLVVTLKDELERLREQAENVE